MDGTTAGIVNTARIRSSASANAVLAGAVSALSADPSVSSEGLGFADRTGTTSQSQRGGGITVTAPHASKPLDPTVDPFDWLADARALRVADTRASANTPRVIPHCGQCQLWLQLGQVRVAEPRDDHTPVWLSMCPYCSQISAWRLVSRGTSEHQHWPQARSTLGQRPIPRCFVVQGPSGALRWWWWRVRQWLYERHVSRRQRLESSNPSQ